MPVQLFIAFVLAYSGMAGLCLCQEKHFKQLFANPAPPSLLALLRWVGWAGLAGSAALSVMVWGGPMGSVAAFGLISIGGLLWGLSQTYLPRWLRAK